METPFKLALKLWIVLLIVMFFSSNPVCFADDNTLQVTIERESFVPIQGTNVYLFNEMGSYLGQNTISDSAGSVSFNLADGTYKIRVDYMGYQFWSPVYTLNGDISETLAIPHQNVTITVESDYPATEPIAGIPVYLFTESGSYMNQNLTTDSSGQVIFNLPEKSYKVRADYRSKQFWSNAFTWSNTTVNVPMAEAEITVTGSGQPLSGINVYAFTATGSYLNLVLASNISGKVSFILPAGEYKFRADYQSSQYWSGNQTLITGQVNPISISTGGGVLTFAVQKGASEPLVGVKCYIFSEAGSYLNLNATTDSSGQVTFNLADGTYKVRVDYMGYQFWSPVYALNGNISEILTIPHQDVTITVNSDYPTTEPIAGVPVYLFTESGSFMNKNLTTDASGQVTFNLPEKSYKVRADYLSKQFWSDAFTWLNATVNVPMAEAEITVTGAGLPLEGVNIYAFTTGGSYLNMVAASDSSGKVTFNLPAGEYKFRADYQSSQYWSDVETLIAAQVNPITISTGGGVLTFIVQKEAFVPLEGVNCYVFNDEESYINFSETTDTSGQVTFNLADGTYKIRVDYMGYQFWSPVYALNGNISEILTIPHQDVTITVNSDYPTTEPIAGVPVYLFTESGSFMNKNLTTDASGQVTFNLPEKSYKVRADYLSKQFWSDAFTWLNATVNVPMAEAEITVTGAGLPLEGVNIYAFTTGGSYLNMVAASDSSGKVTFNLPAGEYKFRADYQSSQYWSGTQTLIAGQVNPITISTGGGELTFLVQKSATEPLIGVKCYAFSVAGSYLNLNATTDSSGQVSFNLADGTYKVRVDYMGYQFWSPVYTLNSNISKVMTIHHQDVAITVKSEYPTTELIAGIPVYLFTGSGSYLSQNQTTNASGQVIFNLPAKDFKVRADYLGNQFWSETFNSQNAMVTIRKGRADIHVTRSGTSVEGAKVYLFSESGSYLGSYQNTNAAGQVQFVLPNRTFRFRVDYNAEQTWSPNIQITPDIVNPIAISLNRVDTDMDGIDDLDETNQYGTDPNKADTDNDGINDGDELTFWNDNWNVDYDGDGLNNLVDTDADNDGMPDGWEIQHALDPSLNDASQDFDGDGLTNLQEYARGTLPYTPNDVDYGISPANNQGGELVGTTINILSGNMMDVQTDVGFASPNRLGLGFQAVYNSQAGQTSDLGFGWSHTYSTTLTTSYVIGSQTYLKITDATGRGVYFLEESSGLYKGAFHELSQVRYENSEYVWYRLDGSKYGFVSTGKLYWMEDPSGNSLNLAYDGQNRLSTVTDLATGRIITLQYNPAGQIQTITGPVTNAVTDGIWATFGYDVDQNLTSVTYADGSGFTYEYMDTNDIHNITAKRDMMNHLLATWGYDANDRSDSNTTPYGTGVTINYAGPSQVDVTDAYGTSRDYTITEINGRNRVTRMTGPSNAPYSDNARAWTYDSNMMLTQVEYTGGRIDRFQNHDAFGNPQNIILGYGSTYERAISFSYHPNMSAVLTRTEPSVLEFNGDKITIWDYDDPNDTNDNPAVYNENPTLLPYRVIEKGYTKDNTGAVVPYEYITEISYNGTGQILTVNGPLAGDGDITSYTYDPATKNLLSLTRPIVGSTGFSEYDAAGFAGKVTDVNSLNTSLQYDGRGRVTNIQHPDGSTETREYNLAGLIETKTNEDGVPHTYDYKTDTGLLDTITDGAGSYIVFTYDANGNQTEKAYYDVDNALTNVKNRSYNHPAYPGLLYREIQPDNTYTQYNYDDAGNVTSITDPKGNTTSYTSDVFNRPSVTVQPGTLETSYEYDLHGNLISVLNAEGHDSVYTFDDMGRVVQVTSPDSGITIHTYDEAGNLRWKTDAKGVAVEYEYDELSRLIDIHFPDSGPQTAWSIAYTYDAFTAGENYGIGRQTGMMDPSGSTTIKYNNRGRAFEKTSTIDSFSFTMSRVFTPAGRVSHMTYPSGRTMDFTLNDCNCSTKKVETTYSGVTTVLSDNLEYRPFGQSRGMTRPKADSTESTVANQYDLFGRITSANPGAPKERTFTYDANGNLETVASAGTPWYNRTYTYNALNQLTEAQGPFGNGTINYTYDNVGNRLTKTLSGITDTFAYLTGTSRIDGITSSWNDGITGDPMEEMLSYTHDVNGNTTATGNRTFVYNQNNRLIRVEEDAAILGEYLYNGAGQRVRKTAGGVTTYFIYDFLDKLLAEARGTGVIQTEYLYRGSARLAKADISQSGSAAIYYYMNDRLGTPEALIDENEQVVWEAFYKPFGEADVHPESSITNNLRFPGQYYDSETGLHYNYHRYYDPGTGRYLTPDPIGLDGGINLYAYVGGNPVNFIDPYGLINIGKAVTGFLSMTDGVTMVGTGIAATAGTAVVTKNPYLTGIIGTYMTPVIAVGIWDIKHGAHLFLEGLREKDVGEKDEEKTCN